METVEITRDELKGLSVLAEWSKMPQAMIDYIKSLPEYNEKIFNKIIGVAK